jgi:hypothetical protein
MEAGEARDDGVEEARSGQTWCNDGTWLDRPQYGRCVFGAARLENFPTMAKEIAPVCRRWVSLAVLITAVDNSLSYSLALCHGFLLENKELGGIT